MGDEKKDDGVGDPIKMLLKESLKQQRNEMMDNFAQILRQLPTGEASSSRETPFKVQVNFDIPLFEGLIDADVVDKWLNLLEGYFSVHNFFDKEKITFALLKVIPHVKYWWDTYSKQRAVEEFGIFVVAPTWDSFRDAIKEHYYPVGSYEDQYTGWTTLRQERDQIVPEFTNISIPYAPNWVSNILSVIWCLNTMIVCIDTFKQKWISWTSPHWARLIDMLSRSSINLRRNNESLDLQIPHNRSREKSTPTHKARDQVEMFSLKTICPSLNTRRATRR
jgi:hypothetical protein